MISTSMQAQATSMGRTLNPTIIPTLNQPVVDPTGKSNMRELFKKGSTRDFINKVAGALGVRTSGAGYNIETTKPRRLAMGEVGVQRYAAGYTSIAAAMKAAKMLREFSKSSSLIGGLRKVGSRSARVGGERGVSNNYGEIYRSGSSIYRDPAFKAYGITPAGKDEVLMHGMTPGFLQRIRSLSSRGSSGVANRDQYDEFNLSMDPRTRANNESLQLLPNSFIRAERSFNTSLAAGTATGAMFRPAKGSDMISLLLFLKNQGVKPHVAMQLADKAAIVLNQKMLAHKGPMTEAAFGKILNNASVRALSSGFRPSMIRVTNPLGSDMHSRNMGLVPAPFKDGVTQLPGYGGGDSIPALLEPGESVVTKTGTRGNQGSLALMNKGYSLDQMLGFEEGVVEAGRPRGGRMLRAVGPSLAIGMGGQMLGQKVGGTAGSAIQIASMIASMGMGFGGGGGGNGGMISRQMDKIPGQLKQPIGPLNNLAQAASKTGGSLSGILRIFGPLLKGFATLLKLTSPIGIAFTGVTLAVGLLIKRHKEHTEELRINRTAFGMTADAAAKAGYKYTDYNKQIKTAIEDAKALKAQNKMIYESMTKANVPIHMTIEQYKKLKVQVKSTMQDYIKLFDQTDRKDVGQTAIQLKAQFMAAGDSAETATAKIYALIDESNKASMAGSAIGTKAFQSIQTLEQAAMQSTKTFESALKVSDVEGQASALLTSFAAINGSIDETVRKSEEAASKNKGVAISVGQATRDQIDSINASYKNQSNLTKQVISEIGKANPELAEVLNSTDTLVSAFAKLKLLVQGTNVDVGSLSGTAAIAAVNLSSIVNDTVKTTGAVGAQYGKYKQLTDQIKALQTAQKGQSAKAQIDSRDAIASLNKQIDKIKKAAQDKINGIRKATEAENSQLEIQKAQLRAQQALATGNMTAYAEEQMSIEQILNESNRKSAEEAINLKAELDIKPLQDQIDALSNKNQKLADNAALAGDKLGVLQKRADTLNTNLTNYSTNLSNIIYKLQTEGEKFKMTEEFKNTMAALETMGKTLNIDKPASSVVDETLKALKNGINAQNVTIYTDQVKDGMKGKYATAGDLYSAMYDGNASDATLKNPYGKDGYLTPDARTAVIAGDQLEVGDIIEDPNGVKYKVQKRFKIGPKEAVRQSKSLGGPVVAGQKYTINDRVNPLGYQQEGFMPSMSGTIYPNIATMPRYDIPSGTKMSGVNISNSPSSNNVYNIDIALNGTTVTVDDVMRSFKRELALVNAKEGIDRKLGGNY
jgi:hypothetical protein